MKKVFLIILLPICSHSHPQAGIRADSAQTSGNPVIKGWYADPEGIIFGNCYWIYPTYFGDPTGQQNLRSCN